MSDTVAISLGRNSGTLQLRRGKSLRWEHSRPFLKGEDVPTVVAELLTVKEVQGANDVDIYLDCPPVQERVVADLPYVRRRSLIRMVALQALRLFRGEGPLITDAAWLDEGFSAAPKAGCVAISLEAAESIAKAVDNAGFRLRLLSPGGTCRELALDLRPPSTRRRQQIERRSATIRVALLAGACWVVVLVASGWRLIHDTRRVAASLKQLEGPRAAVLAAKRSLDSAASMIRILDAQDGDRWKVSTQLVWLSSAVPDSVFLTTIDLSSDGSGRAAGWATHPLDLQPALERASAPAPIGHVRVNPTSASQVAGERRWEGVEFVIKAEH